jgi:hypothetical protein
MQPVDLTKFKNSSGWHVIHNPDCMQYEIKNAKGRSLPGVWTHRRFADKSLFDYLSSVQEPIPVNKKQAKKKKLSVPIKASGISEHVNT